MYNKRVLSTAVSELGKAKKPAKKRDNIITAKRQQTPIVTTEGFKQGPPPLGYKYRIPGDTLYNPTPYPIEAVSDNGIRKTLNPYDTRNVKFPGANYVEEEEKKEEGGEYYDDELTQEEIDDLIAQGYIVEDLPPAKVGGSLLTKKVTCKDCGWEWDAADGGSDLTTCHKCGGKGLVHAQFGFGMGKLRKRKVDKQNEQTTAITTPFPTNQEEPYWLGKEGAPYAFVGEHVPCGEGEVWDETSKSCVKKDIQELPTMYASANPETNKKRVKFIDKANALWDTVEGRKVWMENGPKNYSLNELSKFVHNVKDYKDQATVYEKYRRMAQDDEISGDEFARLYNENNWARFDQNTGRENFKGEYQQAVKKGNEEKLRYAKKTASEVGHFLGEVSGINSVARTIEHPIDTLSDAGQTIVDIGMAAPEMPYMAYDYFSNLFTPWKREYGNEYPGTEDINPVTGQPYWSGAQGAIDLAMSFPFFKAASTPIIEGTSRVLGTKSGLLSKTHVINPWATRLNKYNRVVGEDAIIDMQNSGLVRQTPFAGVTDEYGITRTTPYTSFGIGNKPSKVYVRQVVDQGKTPYVISTNRPMAPSTLPNHGRTTTQFPINVAEYDPALRNYLSSFPASEAKVFDVKPHWLTGYQEVNPALINSEGLVDDALRGTTQDVRLVQNAERSEQLGADAYDVYRGNQKVGEVSGNKTSTGDFEVTDIGVDPQFQKQGIGQEIYKQLNQSLPEGNRVKSWGAFVETNGVKPGEKTWQALEREGLAVKNDKGVYEMVPAKQTSTEIGAGSQADNIIEGTDGTYRTFTPEETQRINKAIEHFNKHMFLPESKSLQGRELLDDFISRINSQEGLKRLGDLGINDPKYFEDLVLKEIQHELGYFTEVGGQPMIALHTDMPAEIAKNITRHEIEHAVQRAIIKSGQQPFSEIDYMLNGLTLKGTPNVSVPREMTWNAIEFPKNAELFPDLQKNLDYYAFGSGGKEKSAFLAEVQQGMLDNGIIDDVYENITPEKVKKAYKQFIEDPNPNKYNYRFFEIMEPTEANFELTSKALNKMLTISGAIGGVGTAGYMINQGATEQPIEGLKKGGTVSKKYSRSLEAKNQLYTENRLVKKRKPKNKKIFSPTSPYFQTGGMINDISEAQNGLEMMNPMNWGVSDYSSQPSFNTAFEKAKKSGASEFLYNGERYTTASDMSGEQQMKMYGITDQQRVTNPSFIRKNLGKLNTTEGYSIPLDIVSDIALGVPTAKYYTDVPEDYIAQKEQDALRLYMGLPQQYGTFTTSRYKPNAYELVGYNEDLPDTLLSSAEIEKWGYPNRAKRGVDNPLKPYHDFIMGRHTVNEGKDERGDYLEYIDKWDLDSFGKVGAVSDFLNKPYDIYGRKYYKDYGNGVKTTMYYTDDELQALNPSKKNFDTLALQRELVSRGYKLPGSTNKKGELDGTFGPETQKALQDWQSKNFRPGQIYTYSEKPDTYYKYTPEGKMLIKHKGTDGKYVEMQDEDGKRIQTLQQGLLSGQVKKYGKPTPAATKPVATNLGMPFMGSTLKQGGIPNLPLNKNRKVLRDWTYGQSIGMLQEADGGIPYAQAGLNLQGIRTAPVKTTPPKKEVPVKTVPATVTNQVNLQGIRTAPVVTRQEPKKEVPKKQPVKPRPVTPQIAPLAMMDQVFDKFQQAPTPKKTVPKKPSGFDMMREIHEMYNTKIASAKDLRPKSKEEQRRETSPLEVFTGTNDLFKSYTTADQREQETQSPLDMFGHVNDAFSKLSADRGPVDRTSVLDRFGDVNDAFNQAANKRSNRVPNQQGSPLDMFGQVNKAFSRLSADRGPVDETSPLDMFGDVNDAFNEAANKRSRIIPKRDPEKQVSPSDMFGKINDVYRSKISEGDVEEEEKVQSRNPDVSILTKIPVLANAAIDQYVPDFIKKPLFDEKDHSSTIDKYNNKIESLDKRLQELKYQLGDPNVKNKKEVREKYDKALKYRKHYVTQINNMKVDEAGQFDAFIQRHAPSLVSKSATKYGWVDEISPTSYKIPKLETYKEKKYRETEAFLTSKKYDNLSPSKSQFERWKFRASASNNDPIKVKVYGTKAERANQNIDIKAKGAMLHFLDQSPLTGYMHNNTKNFYKQIKPTEYLGVLEKNNDGTHSVKYVKRKEFDGDLNRNTFLVRQTKFDDIDFNNRVVDDNFAGHTYWTKKGSKGEVALPISIGRDANTYDYSSGQSVIYIFNYKGDTRYIHFAGSPNDIKKEGERIKKAYALTDGKLTIGLADAGSYSSAVKGDITNNKLESNDYGYVNFNKGTGAGMALVE